ncbi:MAG: hypothetical protein ACTSW1_00645 [Candidatus Hodarchaeales archaeon]
MTKYEVERKKTRFRCDVDISSKVATCTMDKLVEGYGFQEVAKQPFDIGDLLKGENKIKTLGEGKSEKAENLTELADFASYYLPTFVKVERSMVKK